MKHMVPDTYAWSEVKKFHSVIFQDFLQGV